MNIYSYLQFTTRLMRTLVIEQEHSNYNLSPKQEKRKMFYKEPFETYITNSKKNPGWDGGFILCQYFES